MSRRLILTLIIILLLEKSIEKKNKKVFEKTKLKNLILKNRVFKGSMPDDCFFKNGHISEEGYKYYEEVSKNGVSMIYTGAAVVRISSKYEKIGSFRIDKDEYIDDYKKLSDIVHKNNVNIILDLIHPGILIDNGEEKIYGPSKIFNPMYNTTSKEFTKEEIFQYKMILLKQQLEQKKQILMELKFIVLI